MQVYVDACNLQTRQRLRCIPTAQTFGGWWEKEDENDDDEEPEEDEEVEALGTVYSIGDNV